MTETQVTRWRDIPSMVTARNSDELVKVVLPARFQEAIDEAAMRCGAADADAYLEGWERGPWQPDSGTPADAAARAAASLEAQWPPEALAARLDEYGPPS